MKKIIYIILFAGLFGCHDDLDLQPIDKLSPATAFNTEKDLQLYANSFYLILPTGNEIVRGDALSDYLVGRSLSNYISGSFSSAQASGWSWGDLRNVNYFLEHYHRADVTEEAKNHYAGLARFFRAWFYFDKVKQFGDVPWYDKTMDVNDPDVYKPRDSREFVMAKVLEDLDFACANIRSKKDNTSSQITRLVALAFKSRVCLFEGTVRKYHPEFGLSESSDEWLTQAVLAAEEVMGSGEYKISDGAPLELSYRHLFINEAPNAQEVMLAAVNSQSMRVFNDANWYWTSATYGGRYSFTKTFINTFLNSDGTRFTDAAGYNEIPFWEEVKNRDLRLEQMIRMGDYTRDGAAAPPDFTYTYTGYQPIKLAVDSKETDGRAENYNSLPIIRYAEVLLNYAEAKAELQTFTPSDWDATIKVLRERAGIQDTGMPVVADPYLIQNYFPGITDPVLLEVRRERGIELALEGFRYDDLIRWKAGKLLEIQYAGMYVPALDVAYDLNEDGKQDVAFVKAIPATKIPGVYYFLIDDVQFKLSGGDHGNLILLDNLDRSFEDKKYLYPIPFNEIVLNPNLVQNPEW